MAKAKAVTAPVDDDEVELDEVEDEETPTKAAEPEVWGVQSLITLIEQKTGKKYKPREVRTLLRKMAREDHTINREIIPGNKSRYSWSGPDDPEVKAVLRQVKGGAIETAKKAALDKLKADKAKKTAAAPAKASKKGKAAPPPDDDEDDDDE